MWFNCTYSFNNPFMNFFTPFMNFNYMPFNNFMPLNNIFSINCLNRCPIMPSAPVSVFQSGRQREQNTNLENRLAIIPAEKTVVSEHRASTAKTTKTEAENLVHGVKYNQTKGELLAGNVVAGLPADRDPENPLCARYVKKAIVKSGLGPYINGNGEYCKHILRANRNFKEVKVKASELASLPAGSIIVYDAYDKFFDEDGKQRQIGKDGHVLVALGDGRGCSDIIEDIPESKKAYRFIPV